MIDLRLATPEFWDLTFREFYALLERKRLVDQWRESHAARICAEIANANEFYNSKKKPFKAEDFMPRPVKAKPAAAVQNEASDIFGRLDGFSTRAYGLNNEGEREARERLRQEAVPLSTDG